ncbi:MAG: DUF1553 domain-containing protein, partial [Planctomycetaceae bacterium]|nr:DUF1553 domain-containing protein [Planctomycetaceae bacterium]
QTAETDTYQIQVPLTKDGKLSALKLEALPHEKLPGQGPGHAGGNFVITNIGAQILPAKGTSTLGRFVRIEVPGDQKILSLAEVEVFSAGKNMAPSGKATQSSTAFEGPARLAIDGNTNGHYFDAKSTTHTEISKDPWWQLDLGSPQPIDQVVIWNRTDGNTSDRLKNFRILVLNEDQKPVWQKTVATVPKPSLSVSLSDVRPLRFTLTSEDFSQEGFPAEAVIDPFPKGKSTGWAIGPQFGKRRELNLFPDAPVEFQAGSILSVTIEQNSTHKNHTLGHFRLQKTEDPRAIELAKWPIDLLAILQLAPEGRTKEQQTDLSQNFLSIAKELEPDRKKLAQLRKQLADLKPATTVPIMRELPTDKNRVTKIQQRGNYLITGNEVSAGVPAVFHPLPAEAPKDRLALAHWLVDENNPLTARVIANRYWEKIFGIGLVETSEEFGSQGEPPSHPELLDWLATELIRSDWDLKHFIKLLVTSATYQQQTAVTQELLDTDPDNRLLARGPRFRMSAEMIRDQALFVSGLLSEKMYGPPVKPPQPKLGLNAAFGSGIDWKTSQGDDKFRRGLYTMWRRSNPYPSMATFDAPNRDVCTLRRDRTNTPLQALVTLNDPVYVEAAQALGRRIAGTDGDRREKIQFGFQTCVTRPPSAKELDRLEQLYQTAFKRYSASPDLATKMATEPLGPLPAKSNAAEFAAWTVVGNVLLNLDEMFMPR